MNSTITLKEAATLLKYKSLKSVERWCAKTHVPIFIEEGSKRRYLVSVQVEYYRHFQLIQYLQVHYPTNWLEVFQACVASNIISFITMVATDQPKHTASKETYRPIGEHEKSFLTSLSKKDNKL